MQLPYVYRVTKYDPADRDEHGHYTGSEDTVSEHGEVEASYLQAVAAFAGDSGVDHLAVREPQVPSLAHFGVEPPVAGFGLDGLFPAGPTGFHDGAEVPLGSALSAGGDHVEAMSVLRRAHDDLLADEEPDVRMAGRALAAIGLVHDRLGDTQAADRDLKQPVEILRERDAMHYAAEPLERFGDIAHRTGAGTDVVRGYLAEALEIYEREGNPVVEELRGRLAELDDRDVDR
ncbi:hypothetical protein ABZZ80_40795 [Streptomyces sp. NPDC006356]